MINSTFFMDVSSTSKRPIVFQNYFNICKKSKWSIRIRIIRFLLTDSIFNFQFLIFNSIFQFSLIKNWTKEFRQYQLKIGNWKFKNKLEIKTWQFLIKKTKTDILIRIITNPYTLKSLNKNADNRSTFTSF